MPISGLLIRFLPPESADTELVRADLASIEGLELGQVAPRGISAVLEAADYARHDAALARLQDIPGVCAVDLVFHDFSDVTEFDRLPRRQHGARR